MTDTLRAYILRTVTAKAVDYLPADHDYPAPIIWEAPEGDRLLALRGAFRDAARGTDTGWWDGLIYTGDVYRLADAHRRDIAAAVESFWGETGTIELTSALDGCTVALACVLAPTFAAWEAAPSDPEAPGHDAAGDAYADALVDGLRFAVEYLLSGVAAEAGVEF